MRYRISRTVQAQICRIYQSPYARRIPARPVRDFEGHDIIVTRLDVPVLEHRLEVSFLRVDTAHVFTGRPRRGLRASSQLRPFVDVNSARVGISEALQDK